MPMCYSDKVLIYSNIRIELSRFDKLGGVSECHAMLHVADIETSFSQQLVDINAAYLYLLSSFGGNLHPVFKRYFLSDAVNQMESVRNREKPYPPCATSFVEQPPLDGSKIALWVYMQSDVDVNECAGGIVAEHNGYSHIWTGCCTSGEGNSALQTEVLLNRYSDYLLSRGCALGSDCIRTWFFVQNIDVNYSGVVNARKTLFERHGLTSESHYITSTGIEGSFSDPHCSVILDAYAVKGLQKGQQIYLYAKDNMNPTYEYGVTFERGVRVAYGDRSHIFISGTASIDNKGNIVSPYDIVGQTNRMLENINALLKEAGASMEELAQMIIYLRDVADYRTVCKIFDEKFCQIPRVILLAPVCRPGWLIETECIAVKEDCNPQFAPL